MNEPAGDREFYVGYDGTMPPRMARRMRRVTAGLLSLAAAVAGALVWAQEPFAASRFEFGTTRAFRGWLAPGPYPTLRARRPGEVGDAGAWSDYLLVGTGKFAAAGLSRLERRWVTLEGTLAYRDDQTMVEIVPGSVREEDVGGGKAAPAKAATAGEEDLGEARLVGEIVDSKCFLGVMNPGSLQVHRDCAVRCIAGGIPPILVVRSPRTAPWYFLLVSPAGGPVNGEVLAMIATPVAITGHVRRRGTQFYLAADPRTYELLAP